MVAGRRIKLTVAARFALALALALAIYGTAYARARSSHRLVRYESGCVARPMLHRDLWRWSYRCSDLRTYLDPDASEAAFAPLVAAEELGRDIEAGTPPRASVCSLPIEPPGVPSQGFPMFRPEWCPGGLSFRPVATKSAE